MHSDNVWIEAASLRRNELDLTAASGMPCESALMN